MKQFSKLAIIGMMAASFVTAPAPSVYAKPPAATVAKDQKVIDEAITTLEGTKKKLQATSSAKTSQRTQNAINNIKKALVDLRTGTNPQGH